MFNVCTCVCMYAYIYRYTCVLKYICIQMHKSIEMFDVCTCVCMYAYMYRCMYVLNISSSKQVNIWEHLMCASVCACISIHRHCNTLPHTATYYTTLTFHWPVTATQCKTVTCYNTLQHAATRCNTTQRHTVLSIVSFRQKITITHESKILNFLTQERLYLRRLYKHMYICIYKHIYIYMYTYI